MHVSERLLQLYAELDAPTRASIQRQITTSLAGGKPLAASFQELTGETDADVARDVKTADDFTAWLRNGKTDLIFLTYYVALLERSDQIIQRPVSKSMAEKVAETPVVTTRPVAQQLPDEPTRLIREVPAVNPEAAPEETDAEATLEKRRYVAETPMPSRAERMKYQRHIEPARPRRRKSRGLVVGLIITMLLIGGAYTTYRFLTELFEAPTETVAQETATPKPVATEPEVNDVWVTVKNTSLLDEPDGTDVTYIGDIGDRYAVLDDERADYVLLDLGVDGLTAWAAREDVTRDWSGAALSDPQLLLWLETAVDQTYIETSAEDYLQMTEDELYAAIGEPFSRDNDALNDYVFYDGIFFVIQEGRVHAIDWTNTGQSKDALLQLGEPTHATEDAVVYESDTYSLRLFVGATGATRIRLTEI